MTIGRSSLLFHFQMSRDDEMVKIGVGSETSPSAAILQSQVGVLTSSESVCAVFCPG